MCWNWLGEVIFCGFFVIWNLCVTACIVTEVLFLAILVLRALDTNRRLKSKSRGPGGRIQSWIPLYIWGITPYILSCGVRQFLESESDISDWLELQKFIQETLSTTTIATWFHLMLLLVLIGLLYIFVGLIVNGRYLCTFWLANYTSSRTGSRKLWRALDTCASIFTLGSFFNYVDKILPNIDHLPNPVYIGKEITLLYYI